MYALENREEFETRTVRIENDEIIYEETKQELHDEGMSLEKNKNSLEKDISRTSKNFQYKWNSGRKTFVKLISALCFAMI